MTKEADISEDEVWQEHLAAVNVPAHWAYAAAVVVGGFLLMVGLIALLGATS